MTLCSGKLPLRKSQIVFILIFKAAKHKLVSAWRLKTNNGGPLPLPALSMKSASYFGWLPFACRLLLSRFRHASFKGRLNVPFNSVYAVAILALLCSSIPDQECILQHEIINNAHVTINSLRVRLQLPVNPSGLNLLSLRVPFLDSLASNIQPHSSLFLDFAVVLESSLSTGRLRSPPSIDS
jgi:hypothetical protein